MLRTEGPPDDLLVVVRATQDDRQLAEVEIAHDGAESALVYVVADGDAQVIVHGVSVFTRQEASTRPRCSGGSRSLRASSPSPSRASSY